MKLNDFLDKSPHIRSTSQKVITVANEKRENELTAEIQTLQKEVDRLHTVDVERSNFNQRMQAAEIQLHETLEREVEIKAENARFRQEIDEREQVWKENQVLKGEIKDLTGSLGVQEAVLEQSEKNSLELNKTATDLTQQVKTLQDNEASLQVQLEKSLQQTSASINSFGEMKDKLDYVHKMFLEIEVKYKEGQRNNNDMKQKSHYWERVARTLQEEKEELEQTRHILNEWASNVDSENQEKRGAVKVTQAELKKLRGTVATMTKNIDGLIEENKALSQMNSVLKAELARPKYMSMASIERSEGFKLPTGGYRKHFLGNSKPTLLKFKKEVVTHDN